MKVFTFPRFDGRAALDVLPECPPGPQEQEGREQQKERRNVHYERWEEGEEEQQKEGVEMS